MPNINANANANAHRVNDLICGQLHCCDAGAGAGAGANVRAAGSSINRLPCGTGSATCRLRTPRWATQSIGTCSFVPSHVSSPASVSAFASVTPVLTISSPTRLEQAPRVTGY